MVRSLLNSGELWDFDLLWVRDAYLAAALRKRLASKPLCVEVHQAPTRRQTRYFQSADSAETFWGPISELTEKSIRQLICADPERVGRLPMAASEDFFTTGARDCANSSARQTQRIGYFGSFRSGGKDQKVGALAEVVMSMHTQVPVELYLVGIGYEGRRRIEQLVNDQERSNQIKVIEHVEHKRIPNLMHSCDVLVLPYPGEAEFFESRFPIKLVEYAASNRPIVISDTPGHRAIFPENAGYFFTWEAKSSLVDALLRALSDDNEVAERVRIARKWSENLRYENRVEPVLTWLDQRRSQ